MRKRNALYLGDKDKDIVDFIRPLLVHYDFSSIVRELVRDGIKFRQNRNVLQSMNSSQPARLDDLVLTQKELDLDDISSKLDLL